MKCVFGFWDCPVATFYKTETMPSKRLSPFCQAFPLIKAVSKLTWMEYIAALTPETTKKEES